MYISADILINSLNNLEGLHPFFGITYLVCKEDNLPVANTIEYSINNKETEFLSLYYKPVSKTSKFFRVYRPSEKSKYWLNSDYASSGSQANRTQMFSDVFIHPKGSNLWGWNSDYVKLLSTHLRNKKIPAYSIALWMLKGIEWSENDTLDDILAAFFKKFNISNEEKKLLFHTDDLDGLNQIKLYSQRVYNWNRIAESLNIPSPPDLPIEKGGMLLRLELTNVDMSKNFLLNLSSRLNIITGDNGLGKSFILESAWWALTQNWTGLPIYPKGEEQKTRPTISFDISSGKDGRETFNAYYDWKIQDWQIDKTEKKTVPGLVIYARVDGAFAIWDPARMHLGNRNDNTSLPSTLVFSREDIWDGVRVGEGNRSRSIFNGIITDWVHWQNANNDAFHALKKVLKRLSPPDLLHGDLGVLEPGTIVRIPGESRPIPTIKHPYGEVPILFASAAVKRIVALAYLIVWTWEEHKTSSKLMHEDPQSSMVVIADEIEAHLHPQWQRVILPSITSISDDLSDDLSIQFLITTHSPLVMASIEPLFNEVTDKIFHLNLRSSATNESRIVLENPKFEKRGSSDSWLMSDIFELKQPRSFDAEKIIEKAKSLQMQTNPDKHEIENLTKKLMQLLAPHDAFWIRWNYFAEKNGSEI